MIDKDQITLDMISPDFKKPPVWECMETCANAGDFDNFPVITNKKRCNTCRRLAAEEGLKSGDEWVEVVKDNVCTFYCKYYRYKW